MLRAAVVVFHLTLASALTLELGVALAQTRVNLLWERRFYQEASQLTLAAGSLQALVLAIAGMEFLIVLGWWARRRWAGSALLGISALLLLFVTPGLGWCLLAVSLVAVIEELRSRLPKWAEVVEGDEGDL